MAQQPTAELTFEEKELYKDVVSYNNEYMLRQLIEGCTKLEAILYAFSKNDRFVSLKRELNGYLKVLKFRREEVIQNGS